MSPTFTDRRAASTPSFAPRHARRLRAVSLAVLATAGLAACGGGVGNGWLAAPTTTAMRYDNANPIHVEPRPMQLEIPVAASLSDRDGARVAEFVRRFLAQGEGDLTIAYPQNGAAAHAVKEVVAIAERTGAPMRRLVRGPYSTAVDGDRGVVIWFDALAAVGPDCSARPGETIQAWSNETPQRFGCAYQANLAAMIADPRDLLSPRPMSPVSSERRQKVLQSYKQGESTNTETNGERTQTTDG